MRKLSLLLLTLLMLLTACQSSASNFSEVEEVPAGVSDIINKQQLLGNPHRLYMIEDGAGTVYIVYHAQGDVTSSFDEKDGVQAIHLETKKVEGDSRSHVFKLLKDTDGGTIKIQVNGKPVPIDSVFMM